MPIVKYAVVRDGLSMFHVLLDDHNAPSTTPSNILQCFIPDKHPDPTNIAYHFDGLIYKR